MLIEQQRRGRVRWGEDGYDCVAAQGGEGPADVDVVDEEGGGEGPSREGVGSAWGEKGK